MHENVHLVEFERGGARSAAALPAGRDLPRQRADAAADREKSAGHGGAVCPLVTGTAFVAHTDGEEVQLTHVSADFVHWINATSGSTGRMMRRYFLNFFSPLQ